MPKASTGSSWLPLVMILSARRQLCCGRVIRQSLQLSVSRSTHWKCYRDTAILYCAAALATPKLSTSKLHNSVSNSITNQFCQGFEPEFPHDFGAVPFSGTSRNVEAVSNFLVTLAFR